MTVATVSIQNDGSALIRFRFCHSAVEEIKDRIPSYARSFDDTRKEWTIIEGPFVVLAIDILRDIFGHRHVKITDASSLDGGVNGTGLPRPP